MQAIVRGVATGSIFTEFVNVLDFVKRKRKWTQFHGHGICEDIPKQE